NPTGMSEMIDVPEHGHLEEAVVHLRIDGGNNGGGADQVFAKGDLVAFLTSPDGTTSQLMYPNEVASDDYDGNAPLDWSFTSNAFWGEDEYGDWTLKVSEVETGGIADLYPSVGYQQVWENYSLTLNTGDLIPVPEPSAFMLVSIAILSM